MHAGVRSAGAAVNDLQHQAYWRCVQVHFDGCFKVKHSASAGRRGNAAELDAQVPSRIFMADAERDARDARIAANLNIVVDDASKTCNDFKADNADNGYASPLCILGWCARFLHALVQLILYIVTSTRSVFSMMQERRTQV